MNAMRLFISVTVSTSVHGITTSWGLTSIYLALLHVLPRHGVGLDNLGKSVGLEVLLARLFLGAALSGILLHGFKLVCPSSELILSLFEKVARLLAHLDHPVRGVAQHFNDSRDLVILRRSWEQGKSQEQLYHDASEGPHIDGRRIGETK